MKEETVFAVALQIAPAFGQVQQTGEEETCSRPAYRFEGLGNVETEYYG